MACLALSCPYSARPGSTKHYEAIQLQLPKTVTVLLKSRTIPRAGIVAKRQKYYPSAVISSSVPAGSASAVTCLFRRPIWPDYWGCRLSPGPNLARAQILLPSDLAVTFARAIAVRPGG